MHILKAGVALSGTIKPHNHVKDDCYEFHYFLEGSGVFVNDGNRYQVKPGQLFLSRASETHCMERNSEDHSLFYWVRFKEDPLHGDLSGLVHERFSETRSIAIGTYHHGAFEDLRRRSLSADPFLRASADYRFWTFLCDIASGGGHPAGGNDYAGEAIPIMLRNMGKPLALDDLADALGIDKAYFVRVFGKSMGESPMRYYLKLRLDAARFRLRESDDPLRVVAADLGFHDEFHFSHQFKKHYGMSPSAWRELGASPREGAYP